MRQPGSAPWSLIGVGAIILIVIVTIVVVSLKLAFDAGLPSEPLDVPIISQSMLPSVADKASKAARGERVELTLAELSQIAQATVADWASRGLVGPASRAHFEPAGPGGSRVRVRLSFELPATAGMWVSGRFVNLDATLHLHREAGRDRIFEIDRYQYGNLDALPVNDALALIERLRINGRVPDVAWDVWERLVHFQHTVEPTAHRVVVQLRR